MPRLSTLSNPTGLVDIDRQRIRLVLDEGGKHLAFSLVGLNLSELELPPGLNVVVIAMRGNTEERVELGPVSNWNKGFQPLAELSNEGTLKFRILLIHPDSAKLVGAAENVRPEGQGDSSSFIALEAADLGQRPWEIEILELEGRAVIRFNKEVFNSPGEAESNIFFISLILPEAIRRLASWIAANPNALGDPVWEPFNAWLALHGITEEPEVDSTEDEQSKWCAQVVNAFCDRFEFVSQLRDLRAKGLDE